MVEDKVIARLYPSVPRRVFAVGVLVGLGALLLWVAVVHPPSTFGLRLFLLAFGGWMLASAIWLWQATAVGIEMTETTLREEGGGRVLAQISDVRRVSRGALALKPSNGFLLTMGTPGPAVWAPGLWWRIGRRVGVGGVTARHETRFMAEAIAERAERRG